MKLSLNATPVFFDLIDDIQRVNLLRGGTRSSKSYSIMQLTFLWLLTGRIGNIILPKGNFIIIRATMPALRATVMRDWDDYLIQEKVYGKIDHRKTTNTYTYRQRRVEFLSADDPEKLKGRQSTLFWINEADAVSFDVFNQLLIRCEKHCWIDINPSNSDSWIKTILEDDRMPNRNDVSLHVSTYLDNPYLGEEMIKEIMGLKFTDEELYKVYTLGEWAKLSGRIYDNWSTIDEDDVPNDLKVGYGLDFGFSNNPTALVKCTYDKENNTIYVQEKIYEKELLNSVIAQYIKENCKKFDPVVADSAEPKSIRELQTLGVKCVPAVKGKDSVKHGINRVKQLKIYVTSDSINLVQEFQRYKWKKDVFGNPMNEPISMYNHGLDAIRYFVGKIMGGGGKIRTSPPITNY